MRSSLVQFSLGGAIAALLLTACSNDEEQGGDGQLGQSRGAPQSPADPSGPQLETCPDGFVTFTTPEGTTCELQAKPEEPRLQATCPAGWEYLEHQVDVTTPDLLVPMCRPHVPSMRCADNQRLDLTSGSCVPIGQPCSPDGSWPHDLPFGTATIYVRAGSAGYGTADAPFGSFDQALQSTPDGGVLVVGPGTYPVNARIERPVTIVGVCSEQVVFEGPESSLVEVTGDPSSVEGTLQVEGAGDLVLRNVTLRGRRVGLHVKGARATVHGVRFDQNTNKAIVVSGGALELSDSIVERTLPLPDGRKGRGLQVNAVAQVTVRNVTFQDNDRNEVFASGIGTEVELTDVALQNTRMTPDAGGIGLAVTEGARVRATRALVRSKTGTAIYGLSGADLSLDHTYVVRTVPDSAGWGVALNLEGARAHVERSVFLEQTLGSIRLEQGSVLTGSDLAIASTYGHPGDLSFGRGISAFGGSSVDLERVTIANSEETAVYVSGAEANLRDLTLRDNGACGLIAELDADLSVTRAWSRSDQRCGAIVRKGSHAQLVDFAVDDVIQETGRDGTFGWGIFALNSSLELERVAVRRAHQFGLAAFDTDVDLTGVVVEDVRADASSGAPGQGVAFRGGDVSLQGLIVRRSEGAGLVIGAARDEEDPTPEVAPPTTLSGSDVTVEATLPAPPKDILGMGLSLFEGAEVTLSRVLVTGSHSAGLNATYAATGSFSDLIVRDTQPSPTDNTYGYGIAVQNGARLQLERSVVMNSWTMGMFISGSRSSVQATDLSVLDTRPIDGEHGMGIGVLAGAGLTVERARLSRHHSAGLLAQFGGAVRATDLSITEIQSGTFTDWDIFGGSNIEGAGDCVLALSRATVELERASLSDCSRVGVLFDDAFGSLTDVGVQQTPMGIALQGFPRPELSWSSVGVQSSPQPLVTNAGLKVPATSPPVLSVSSELGNLVRTP